MHTQNTDIPLQGALQKQEQDVVYAVIIQNGILLGSGRISMETGTVDIVQHTQTARPLLIRIGNALARFLARPKTSCPSQCSAPSFPTAPSGCIILPFKGWLQQDKTWYYCSQSLNLNIQVPHVTP